MTALVIADLHLSAKPRDNYRFQAMGTIADLLEKHRCDELIVLGDLCEEKDFHSAGLVNDVVDIMYSFSQFCKVYIDMGNHDYTSKDCPFFHFLRRLKRVFWFNTVSKAQLSIGDCLFLPHTRDYAKDWEELDEVYKIGMADWVFAHNTFEGSLSEHGKKLSGIPTSVFPDDARVFSGDIHTPQTVGPVTYIGSPYLVDFGDDFEPRVILIQGHVDKPLIEKIVSIPIPGPQKRLIDIKFGDDLRRHLDDTVVGDIVKVRYTLDQEEQPKWLEKKAKIKKACEERGLIVHLIQPVVTKKQKSIAKNSTVSHRKSDEAITKEFGQQLKVTKGTLEAGLRFVEKA